MPFSDLSLYGQMDLPFLKTISQLLNQLQNLEYIADIKGVNNIKGRVK
jgi:hypothetical protein